MLLDTFTSHSLVVQVSYEDAFELWDGAGEIARRLSDLWGGLKVAEGTPQQQVLKGSDIIVNTSFNNGILTMLRDRASPSKSSEQVKASFDIWRDVLELKAVHRVSARSVFHRKFPTLGEANKFVTGLGLVRIPQSQVFNQDQDAELNGVSVSYRFQDDKAFSVLRVKAERAKFHAELDREFVDEAIEVEKCRVVIDFDRGTLGSTDAAKLRLDEWLKGYQHLMRRDIPKVLGQ
jgi:hypothetical protein